MKYPQRCASQGGTAAHTQLSQRLRAELRLTPGNQNQKSEVRKILKVSRAALKSLLRKNWLQIPQEEVSTCLLLFYYFGFTEILKQSEKVDSETCGSVYSLYVMI